MWTPQLSNKKNKNISDKIINCHPSRKDLRNNWTEMPYVLKRKQFIFIGDLGGRVCTRFSSFSVFIIQPGFWVAIIAVKLIRNKNWLRPGHFKLATKQNFLYVQVFVRSFLWHVYIILNFIYIVYRYIIY